MRQTCFKYVESLRSLVVIGILSASFAVTGALAQNQPQNQPQGQPQNTTDAAAPSAATDDGALTREEILAVFQREARAAYQMHREECAQLPTEQQKVCLAKARLQFDEDMRYAQRRADQGY